MFPSIVRDKQSIVIILYDVFFIIDNKISIYIWKQIRIYQSSEVWICAVFIECVISVNVRMKIRRTIILINTGCFFVTCFHHPN